MKQATLRSKGFGAAPKAKAKAKRRVVVPLAEDVRVALDALADAPGAGLEKYLNPQLFEDPATMQDIGRRLRSGEVVLVRDATEEHKRRRDGQQGRRKRRRVMK